jgi:2'-5' RNA ligase
MRETESERLFFAVDPPEVLRAPLSALSRTVLPQGVGRAVAAENLHLTLVFLGEVEAPRRACAEEAAAAVRGAPFQLTLDHLGWWGTPQVLWAAPASTPPELVLLVKDLERALKTCDHRPEQRTYQAHLTLARKVARPLPLPPMEPLVWEIGEFVLYRSDSVPGGSRYVALRRFPLTGH